MSIQENMQLGYIREHMFSRSGGASLLDGNEIHYLMDSTDNFPAWKEALQSAQEYICIEMYIFADNKFGQEIRQVLIDKLKQGVRVYLIYDWFGCFFSKIKGFFKPLIEAGAQVASYNRPTLVSGLGILSRNHRKSIIVDGEQAFVSGLCISSVWEGNSNKGIAPWRDSGLKLRGPIVKQVLQAFEDTWSELRLPLPQNDFIENRNTVGLPQNVFARVIATTPKNANMVRLDLAAISIATKTLWLTDAYFMPSKMYIQALVNAAEDGVDVRILVPRTTDIKWIGAVSRIQYRRLLEAGVRVFEWKGSMIHAKTSVVDGEWARVGSTNLNFSSWFANRELDVVFEGEESVKPLVEQFQKDLENAREIILNKKDYLEIAEKKRAYFLKNRSDMTRLRARAIARQFASMGNTINQRFQGRVDEVDSPEMVAYAFIGIITIIVAIIVYFFPKLIAIPVLVVLFAVSLVCLSRAFKAYQSLYKSRQEQKKMMEIAPSDKA